VFPTTRKGNPLSRNAQPHPRSCEITIAVTRRGPCMKHRSERRADELVLLPEISFVTPPKHTRLRDFHPDGPATRLKRYGSLQQVANIV